MSFQAGLEAFLAEQLGRPVAVRDLQPVSSVGNARDPWSFTIVDGGAEQRCVMLVKAEAGQLETTLGPEFATIAGLDGTGVPVAKALWIDESATWIGQAFFVTAFVPGTADTRVLRGREPVEAIRRAGLDLAAAAARLHDVAIDRFTHLPTCTVHDAAEAQLAYWEDQFLRHRLEAHPALVYAIAWLRRRRPVARRVSIVHGDLRFGNLLYDPEPDGAGLTALLDWEMVHLGDPVEDLGWVYRDLWTPVRSLPFDAFLDAYVAAGGTRPDPEHLRWYRVFCEVKHSVISLTAARSFADGATRSLRHADRAATVPAFIGRILELVEDPC